MTDATYVITVRGVAGPWVRAALDDMAVSTAGDTKAGGDPDRRRAGCTGRSCGRGQRDGGLARRLPVPGRARDLRLRHLTLEAVPG